MSSGGLKNTVLEKPKTKEQRAADTKRNVEAYAKMLKLLNDKILLLIIREACDNRRKALNI